MRLPTNDAIAALGASVVNREHLPATIAVSTDTRAIRPSETFLALRGENFDGHRFIAEAVAGGASAVIVDDAAALPEGQAGFVVADTLAAYLALGALARERVRGPVIAITGSTGKTTTKTFAVQALEAAGQPVTATPENENNEIGVAKFLLSLDEGDERVAIVEFGARKYLDLEPLVRAARPDIGVLTNIGEAHLEIMGSYERLVETKWGLFAGGARPVLNLGDEVSRERAASLTKPPIWFGVDAERPERGRAVIVRVEDVLEIEDGAVRALPLHVDVPGAHNRRNLAAAFAAAWAAGVDPESVAVAAPHFELPHGRYQRMQIAGGPTVIYDAYNASMSGALATLAAFARERVPARRIVVLGSMAELGADSPVMHQKVGAAAAASADIVLVGGAFADSLSAGAQAMGLAPDALIVYQTNDDAIAWLREHARPDDVVLLKGSRMYRMEQIVAGLSA
jgi:UDP-N-acetylmuramoyl-tripeptide--D-alanyl-D-alanine ligase